MAKIVSGDDVIVIAGSDKGKIGKVVKILRKGGHVVAKVAGVALCRKSVKPSKDREGGIFSVERFIDISNIALFDSEAGVRTKVGYKFVDGKKVRYLKGSGRVLD
ncbi:50S ribosomal protein L24 [Anaplasma marginale]|nr:50S ribosomal protein L24 [Anaplasma marginale]AXW84223.1 50S ribosomal protein L24 [Anaplasma marginale]AXW85147.1 50S ribosomal protein L24 [Anaplasma marginale]KAA8472201.1 50S ribosomal protein L24 [Anaplasma marginale]KAA8473992.1 50S ribosomal protein L24 [Anaplasma marginale]KAB0450537.1 50S ribosomal protein L24 [Anaplasma marginale]